MIFVQSLRILLIAPKTDKCIDAVVCTVVCFVLPSMQRHYNSITSGLFASNDLAQFFVELALWDILNSAITKLERLGRHILALLTFPRPTRNKLVSTFCSSEARELSESLNLLGSDAMPHSRAKVWLVLCIKRAFEVQWDIRSLSYLLILPTNQISIYNKQK
jgi:hypothetical protein